MRELLDFWFAEGPDTYRTLWFRRDDGFDAELRRRFTALLDPAREGELDEWADAPEGALALVLLLDQLSRNLHRGTPRAFAADPHAREVARTAVLERRFDLRLTPTQRIFLYLPFEHAEDAAAQNLSVTLFEGLRDHRQSAAPDGAISYAWRHRDVIQRFGRFPHRNAVLGRVSSPAEQVYLAEPGAGF